MSGSSGESAKKKGKGSGALKLVERDYAVMREITRWRFLLGRQIKTLCGFSSFRTCDRRIAKLIEAGYLERKHYIYGTPGLYFVTQRAVSVFNLDFFTPKIRTEQIVHDIAVIDTAIYLLQQGVKPNEITTERELKHLNGFGNPKHEPDFIYTRNKKSICVEVELSAKKQATIERNIKENYMKYDIQQWIVPSDKLKILQNIELCRAKYPNIEIIPFEEVENHAKHV